MKVLMSGNIASIGYQLCKGLRARQVEADLVYQRTSEFHEGTEEDWIITYQHPCFEPGKPTYAEKDIENDRVKKKVMNIIPKFKDRIQYLTLPNIDLSQYDLFQLNYLGNKLNIGIALRHKLKSWNKPIIVYLVGFTTPMQTKGRQGIRNYIITHRAKILLYDAPYLYDRIQHFKQEKILLPIPINTDQFKATSGEVHSKRVLCWVKLEKVKGIDIIYKTAKLLPKYQFDIPYGGYRSPDAEHYKKIKPKNVNLISGIPHEKVPELINKYPMVLGQFYIGSYGTSELEAMACVKPVIAYWKREYDSFFEGPCPILSSKEPKEIVKLIESHIEDKKLGELSREWVEKYHSIERITEKINGIYKQVLE